MAESILSNKKFKEILLKQISLVRKTNTAIQPNSKYFGQIGSTELEDISYNKQLEAKKEALLTIFTDLLSENQLKTYEVRPSLKIYEYRLKMEFVCSYDPFHEPPSRFGQRKKNKFSWVIDMDECNLIDSEWFTKLRKVYDFLQKKNIRNYDLVKQDGELRYLTIKEHDNQAMLIITTKSNSNEEKINEAAEFALKHGFSSVYWVVNSTYTDTSEGETIKYFGHSTIEIKLGNKIFSIGPSNFFQNNILCFEKILEDIKSFIYKKRPQNHDLIDLYCGVGTLGICLAENFNKIYGIDNSQANIKSAEENAKLNNIMNVKYQVADLYIDDLTSLKSIENKYLIVDPPRTGLGEKSIEEVLSLKPQTIIYISCNPVTQYNDLRMLTEQYKISFAMAYDMFPHTLHIENMVILERI